jgi:hypothetical protein
MKTCVISVIDKIKYKGVHDAYDGSPIYVPLRARANNAGAQRCQPENRVISVMRHGRRPVERS